MSLNDPIANALVHIINCERIGRKECLVKPISKLMIKILTIFNEKGYIGETKIITDKKGGIAKINLLGNINKCGVIKPRFSINKTNFEKFQKRYLPAKNFGIIVVSTSKGLMTLDEAKEKKTGGKLIAYCY